MKKYGFTLAEVLITLAIIGVVAALSLPTLSVSTQKAQIGPSLAKAVNTMETSTRTLMAQEESASLGTTCEDMDLFACLDNYGILSASLVEPDEYEELKTNIGSEKFDTYVTKDGIAFIQITSHTNPKQNLNPNKYSIHNYNILVDVNGPAKKPNKIGRDVFQFIIDYRGNVLAGGSYAYAVYMDEEDGTGKAQWIDLCNKDTNSISGYYCAASIIDNGYKVIYDWDKIIN